MICIHAMNMLLIYYWLCIYTAQVGRLAAWAA